MLRRTLLQGGALSALHPLAQAAELAPQFAPPRALARPRFAPDRIVDVAACTRPFRLAGPRLEAERRHGKTIVHHYGHGGSGWSLSWGSAQAVLPLILATHERRIAIVGCGAIGLTTARVAQRAGLRVRILAKDRPPEVRSSAATGWWSPDSRIALAEHATPEFTARWETMARASFRSWQQLLGLPEQVVEWIDAYSLSTVPHDQDLADEDEHAPEPEYAELEHRINDLRPRGLLLPAGEHPFGAMHVRRFSRFVFNLASYQRLLMADFLREGGELETREFNDPREFAGLRESCIVNCTGYGARALFKDETVVPVRGQTARLIPQPEVDYGLWVRGGNVVMVPRRDGLIVQGQGPRDYGNADATPDRAASEAVVRRLAQALA